VSEVRIYPNGDGLARAAAECFVARAEEATATRGRFVTVLSGGSTPRAAYALLASETFALQVDWQHVHVFWSDERCVPPNHPDSNYRMARETLLDQAPIPPDNIHRMRGELLPQQAAAAYRQELEATLGADGRFDLILLGMGTDGHTASLFPETTALEEQELTTVAVYVDRLQTWRVTLTLPTINAARHALFLVSGAAKAGIVQAVLESPERQFPAQQVRPESGQLVWLLDAPAAGKLEREM
jgi:6-phosphogluconolactonase